MKAQSPKQLALLVLYAIWLASSSTNTHAMKDFTPDVLITEKTEKDKTLLNEISELFFEQKNLKNLNKAVYDIACTKHGAQEITLYTKDKLRISALYFKRQQAPINIIYVAGYFLAKTPPKEWACPFAKIFPDYNILTFDWRGFGKSEGKNPLLGKNDFGANAYPDIQAAIDFVRKDNNKPIVLHGFCLGAAMAIYTTLKAQETGNHTADALGLSCIFPEFEDIYSKVPINTKSCLLKCLLSTKYLSPLISYAFDNRMNGSLFDINPIDMIKEITIPCWFDHPTNDNFSVLDGAITVYNQKKGAKYFLQSDIGEHVRIHSRVPNQYKQAYNQFLTDIGLLK